MGFSTQERVISIKGRRRAAILAGALVFGTLIAIPAHAQDNFWRAARGDLWFNANNWTLGAPSSTQRVFINNPAVTTQHDRGSTEIQSVFSLGGLALTGGSISLLSTSEVSQLQGFRIAGESELKGAGSVDVHQRFDFFDGWMSGSGTTNALGMMVFGSDATKTIYGGRKLNMHGDSFWVGGGNIAGDGTAEVNLLAGGRFEMRNDANFSAGVFNNMGFVLKRGGDPEGSTIFNTEFNNHGAVRVESGCLRFLGGGFSDGSFTVASGACIDFGDGLYRLGSGTVYNGDTKVTGGVVRLESGVSFTGDTQVLGGELRYNAGAGLGSGSMWVGNEGTLHVESGIMHQTGIFHNLVDGDTLTGGTFKIDGNSQLKFASNGIHTNAATIILDGAGSMFVDEQDSDALSHFRFNTGTIIIQPDSAFDGDGASLMSNEMVGNSGTLIVGNSGTLSADGIGNSGTLEIKEGGQGSAGNGGYTQGGGSTTVNGLLSAGGGVSIMGGSLGGGGTIDGNVGNSGTLTPGNSPGTLTINGNFTQNADGVTEIQLGGLATTEFDRLVVNGSGNLDGTLNVSLYGGFTPHFGDSFKIMLFSNGYMGHFSTIAFPAGQWQIQYNTFDVTLRAVPEPASLAAMGLGLAGLALMRKRRKN